MSIVDKKTQSVVITPDDCKAALEFWKHFKVPMPANLQEAFSNFISDPTYENQTKVKYYLTAFISTTDSEVFKDPMFKEVVKESEAVAYDMAFDLQLEEVLSNKDKP